MDAQHAVTEMDAGEYGSARDRAETLVPGRNCWRIERAQRLGFLIDGAQYFAAVRAALARAKRSIFILGWDIDSRMRLVPSGANDGLPEPLGEFLHALAARQPDLEIYILSWDFAILFAFEREWLPTFKQKHHRLSFRLDDRHPPGGSHHQKVIVIDDAVAFVSGFDLTLRRWDTPEHQCANASRIDHEGKPYLPFHDLGAVVDGAPARALGQLARDRWQRATHRETAALAAIDAADCWPDDVEADITDVDVAISRTDPPFEGRPGVRELRQLHLDAIERAQRWIYAENQYFTGRTIADALASRLEQPEGVEVAIVSPMTQSGWLEVSTMGVLRARMHQRLREIDRGGRYRLYCPHLPGLAAAACLNVHSKILIVDDEFLTLGSANLSDRSMGLDTECNLAIEAKGDQRIRSAIAGLRNRLLGEHLDRDPAVVAAETARRGSLIGAIDALRGPERSLLPLEPVVAPELDMVIPDQSVIDPEQSLDPGEIAADLIPHKDEQRVAGRLVAIALLFFTLAALALAWRYTPLQQWANLETLVRLGTRLEEGPFTPVAVMLAYVVGGLLVLPVTLLIAGTGVVFGPLLGAVYSLAGATLSALVTYTIGAKLGRNTIRRMAGRRLNELSRRFAKRGLIAMIFVRIVPVAPFTIVNVVAGASHVSLRDFILGTVIGLLPGTTLIVLFIDRIIAAIREPGVATFALVALVVGLIVAATLMVRRRIARDQIQKPD